MFRDVVVKELTDLETGKPAGFMVEVGCMALFCATETEARKCVIAIANDPEGHEREFYRRKERYEKERDSHTMPTGGGASVTFNTPSSSRAFGEDISMNESPTPQRR